MTEDVINVVSARQATATVNEWLVSYVGDGFLADSPTFDHAADVWRIPILYVHPKDGPLGRVGEVEVDALTGAARSAPPVDEIKRCALRLYEAKHGKDSPSLPRSRD